MLAHMCVNLLQGFLAFGDSEYPEDDDIFFSFSDEKVLQPLPAAKKDFLFGWIIKWILFFVFIGNRWRFGGVECEYGF